MSYPQTKLDARARGMTDDGQLIPRLFCCGVLFSDFSRD
jgi:hypothetical protein